LYQDIKNKLSDKIVDLQKTSNAISDLDVLLSLAEVAKDDPIAKDSIANLGVVLLDLKGNCAC
jgi:DNA mismatch repair ATPase MutS